MSEQERRDLDAWAERTRAQSAVLHDGAARVAYQARSLREGHRLAASERVERRIAEEHRSARRDIGLAGIG